MSSNHYEDLSRILKDNNPNTIQNEIKKIYKNYYSGSGFKKVKRCIPQVTLLFNGKFKGYRECNTDYHDLTHTLDALLAAMRLVDGYNLKNKPLSEEMTNNLLIATLFHDTGYIQEDTDREGTGAKYTSNHVERSINFLNKNFLVFGITKENNDVIGRIIKCTGLSVDLDTISFKDPSERICGSILGTADLLGQMSARDYLEKLLFLYYEFKEANIPGFNTEFDILRKTIDFYEITNKRFSIALNNMFEYAQIHFNTRYNCDRNLYAEAINKNINYIHRIIEDESTNFRHKLKRGSWIDDGKDRSDKSISH